MSIKLITRPLLLSYLLLFIAPASFANSHCADALKELNRDYPGLWAQIALRQLQERAVHFKSKSKDHATWHVYIDQYISKLSYSERSFEVDFRPVALVAGDLPRVGLDKIYQVLVTKMASIIYGNNMPLNSYILESAAEKVRIARENGLYAFVPSANKKNPSHLFLLLVDRVEKYNHQLPSSLWMAKIDNATARVYDIERMELQ